MAQVLFVGIGILWLLIVARFSPDLLAPRCPLCGARLEQREDTSIARLWKLWHWGWRRFSCTRCLYYHRRPVIYRQAEETKHEASALR